MMDSTVGSGGGDLKLWFANSDPDLNTNKV